MNVRVAVAGAGDVVTAGLHVVLASAPWVDLAPWHQPCAGGDTAAASSVDSVVDIVVYDVFGIQADGGRGLWASSPAGHRSSRWGVRYVPSSRRGPSPTVPSASCPSKRGPTRCSRWSTTRPRTGHCPLVSAAARASRYGTAQGCLIGR